MHVQPPAPLPRDGAQRRTSAAARWLLGILIMMLAGLAAGGSASATTPTPSPDDSGIAVNGTLRNSEGTLLEGVTVTAVGGGGSITVYDVSGADGRFEIQVPEPGTYLFRVEEDTLPEGTTVLQGEVTREVAEDRLATVIFRFGEERGGLDTAAAGQFLRLLVDGIRFGLIIGISAVGLSLIFGTTGLTNFAHGDLVTIGAVVAWTINVVGGVQLIPATLIAIVVGGFIGALNEWAIWRRLRRRGVGLIAQLVVSIGLAIALRYLVLIFFGLVPMFLAMPFQTLMVVFAEEVWDVGPTGLGLLSAFAGIGGVAGSFYVAWQADSHHRVLDRRDTRSRPPGCFSRRR